MKFKAGDIIVGTFSNDAIFISKVIGFESHLTDSKYILRDIFATQVCSFDEELKLYSSYADCQYILYEDFLNATRIW